MSLSKEEPPTEQLQEDDEPPFELTVSQLRMLILCFDIHCLVTFSLMFLVDPEPYARVYFLFYLTLLTLPTSYVVVYGNSSWMKFAFAVQFIRMIFVFAHDVVYPIFVASFISLSYRTKHPDASFLTVFAAALARALIVLLMSIVASTFEPVKLFYIQRIQQELEAPVNVYDDVENGPESVSMMDGDEMECLEDGDEDSVQPDDCIV